MSIRIMPAHQKSITQMLRVDVWPNKEKGTIPGIHWKSSMHVKVPPASTRSPHIVSGSACSQSMSLVSIQNKRNKLTRPNPSRAVWDKLIYICCEVQFNAKPLDPEKEHSPTTTTLGHPSVLTLYKSLPIISNHLANRFGFGLSESSRAKGMGNRINITRDG
jgi:hypothetical protein